MTELTYKKERRAFVAHSGILRLQEEGDLRSSQVWCREDYPSISYEDVLRGYIDKHGVYLVKGSEYLPVALDCIPEWVLHEVFHLHTQVFGYHYRDITVWTGLEKGEENELWMPRTLIGKFTPQMIFHPIGEAA